MKILNIQQNTDEWLEARKGKVTGSKLKDLIVKRGTAKKLGFYQLIADRLAIDPDGEDVMERGHRLEEEALDEFEKTMGFKVGRDCGMWISDDNENIAVSPDGCVESDGEITVAVEVKCLSSAKHIQAIVENSIPYEYMEQRLQYFVVNEKLETLYFIFYDPRVASKPLHIITVDRKDVEGDIELCKNYQLKELAEIERIVAELAF